MSIKNIKRIDFETGCYTSDNELIPGTTRQECVLFNNAIISEKEVKDLIRSGKHEYDPRVIVTTQIQAQNLAGKSA